MFGLVPFGARRNLAKADDNFRSFFDVFNEPFFTDALFPAMNMASGTGFKVDVRDLGDTYELTAELPGFKKEDISLSYENGYLTIATEKAESNDEKDEQGSYLRRERRLGSMSRSFYIDNIDEDKVAAEFTDGILKIDLPKMTEDKKKTSIAIK